MQTAAHENGTKEGKITRMNCAFWQKSGRSTACPNTAAMLPGTWKNRLIRRILFFMISTDQEAKKPLR